MRLSDLLFQLIHSLTRSEIQAFKERAGNRGTGKYLRLFDHIAGMHENDESVLLKKFKGDPILNNISVAKNYLYKSLLEAMARTHHDEESQLQSLVQKIKFLIDKGLYQHVKLLLPEAETLATAQEDFNTHLLVFEYERTSITLLHQNLGAVERLREIRKKEKDLAAKITVLQRYQHLSDIIHEYHNKPEKLKALAATGPLKNRSQINSLRAEIMFEMVHFSIARYLVKTTECISRLSAVVKLFEKNPHFLSDQNALVKYMEALTNLAHFYLVAGKFSEATGTAKKITAISEKMRRVEVVAFERYYPVMISYSLYKEDHLLGKKLVDEISEGKSKFAGRIQKKQEVVLDFSAALVLYNLGNLAECQRFLNHLLYHADSEIRPDLQCAARIVQLVLYLDTEDYVSIENQLSSIRRFLKSNHFFPEFTLAFLSFARKNCDTDSPKERKILEINFRKRIEEIFQNRSEQAIENYFEIRKWLDKKPGKPEATGLKKSFK